MLCVAAAGVVTSLIASSFTLGWTHSVEHTRWMEDWVVRDGQLVLERASVAGSGAGIDLPADAVLREGRWHFKPQLEPQQSLILAASGMTPSPWTLCTAQGECLTLGASASEPIRIWAGERCADQ